MLSSSHTFYLAIAWIPPDSDQNKLTNLQKGLFIIPVLGGQSWTFQWYIRPKFIEMYLFKFCRTREVLCGSTFQKCSLCSISQCLYINIYTVPLTLKWGFVFQDKSKTWISSSVTSLTNIFVNMLLVTNACCINSHFLTFMMWFLTHRV